MLWRTGATGNDDGEEAVIALKAITTPSAALMNRFRYAGKFGLLGAVVALAIALLLWQIIAERNRAITAMEHERIGLQYLDVVRPAWMAIQRHRRMSATMANGDLSVSDALAKEQAAIDKQLAQVTAMIEQQPVLAPLGEKWKIQAGKWDGVKKDAQTLAEAQGFERHTRYLEALDAHVRAAAAQTSLTLDPVLGRNLLIGVAVNELPAFIEAAAKLRGLTASVVARKRISETDAAGLRELMAQLKLAQNQLADRIKTAAPLLGDTGKTVTAAVSALDGPVTDAFGQLELHVFSESFDVDAKTFFNEETSPVAAGIKAAKIVNGELDMLLQAGSAELKRSLALTAGAAGIVVLMLLYLGLGMYFSVADSVQAVVDGG